MFRAFDLEDKERLKANVYMKDRREYLGVDLLYETLDDRYFTFWISDNRVLSVPHTNIDRISYYVDGREES